MSEAAEILKSVQIGLNVVIFLLNTDRGLQATELCNECVILLQNLGSGSHLNISDELFNAYYAIYYAAKDKKRWLMEDLEMCVLTLENIRKLKNIKRKHLPSR